MNTFFRKSLTVAYKLLREIHKIVFALMVMTQASAGEVVIVAFGDSLTAGYGLPQEDGFAPQLERWLLNAGADVRVINAGVSGDTTAAGLARIDWVLDDSVDAVILELGANDFLRGLNPSVARENIDAIMAVLADKNLPVLIAGMPAPTNYGAEYKTAFDAIYPDMAAKYDVALYPFFMNGIAKIQGQRDVMTYIQQDGLHPSAEGVLLIVSDLGAFVLEMIRGLD